MVVTVTLHMVRVFYHGAYKPPREFNWVIGVTLFLITLLLSFTGYLLPWDQIGYWAITVGSNMAELRAAAWRAGAQRPDRPAGGRRRPTLIRFYTLHVIGLPLAAAVLMAVHFWRIRKDGGEAGPPPPSRRELEAGARRARRAPVGPLSRD